MSILGTVPYMYLVCKCKELCQMLDVTSFIIYASQLLKIQVSIEPGTSRMQIECSTIEPIAGWKTACKTAIYPPAITCVTDRIYNNWNKNSRLYIVIVIPCSKRSQCQTFNIYNFT